jgi:hypothetical protein
LEVQAASITIDSTSKIDVSNRGYLGGWQGGNNSKYGMTYGNTTTGGSGWACGGSYGGLGGVYSTNLAGAVYGDLMNPDEVGSGGGGENSNSSYPGSNGGGLVKISADTRLTLDGSIISDGGDSYYESGGSGGGILLKVGTLTGAGTISAKGGKNTYPTSGDGGAAGGGGRIAIYYTDKTGFTGTITAAGGLSAGTGVYTTRNGGAGTIYLKDRAQTNGDLILNNNGVSTTTATPFNGGTYANLAVTGANIAINGDLTLPGDLTLDNSQLTFVTGKLNVAGALTLKNTSTLTHAVSTTTTSYQLEVQAASIIIDSASKIDVTGKGYLGGWISGNSGNGMTRDPATGLPTITGGSYTQNGGTYGGLGGITNTGGTVNASYGDLMNPDEVGSGGGGAYNNSGYPGGNGGGLVKITAGTLTLNGSIIAEGGKSPTSNYAGGGSGGGVLINVYTLAGSGTISAKGGDGSTNNQGGGGGGGGRIAIYYDAMTLPTANIITSGGKYGSGATASYNGADGTIYYYTNSIAQ